MKYKTNLNQTNNFWENKYQLLGLSNKQANYYLSTHKEKRPALLKAMKNNAFLSQLWGPVPWLIEFALIWELILGKYFQAIIVLVLLLFSAIDSQIQNRQAKKALGPLNQQLIVKTRVKRKEIWQTLKSTQLVPKDIVHLHRGDIIPGDILILMDNLSVDQAVITGESREVFIGKGKKAYAGSTVLEGGAIVKVLAVGSLSSYGKTIQLTQEKEIPGSLSILLFKVVKMLAYLDALLVVVLILSTSIQKVSWQFLLPFIIILFIATIPISMPASFSVANSIEAHRLAKKNILTTQLSGLQEAASIDTLLVDKTGTLTQTHPQLTGIYPRKKLSRSKLLALAGCICDPTSKNPLDLAIRQKINKIRPNFSFQILDYKAFNSQKKYAWAKIKYKTKTGQIYLGSPTLIANMNLADQTFLKKISSNYRVLAVSWQEKNSSLQLLGFLTFAESLKPQVYGTLKSLKQAGIQVIMATGDELPFAQHVARQAGIQKPLKIFSDNYKKDLNTAGGFAKTTPKEKLSLVKKLQKQGKSVAMIGDGINDGPAISQANLGICVNQATDIAKKASQVVISQNGLADILQILESGHRIYRRMLTWALTKLVCTACLTALLTLGFILSGHFPIGLSIIVYNIVLNDLVTLTLGTDKTQTIKQPEHWNIFKLVSIASTFTLIWLIVGLGLFFFFIHLKLGYLPTSSLIFAFLIYSAMATIMMTRTSQNWWQVGTSRLVGSLVLGNIIVTSLCAILGVLIPSVSGKWLVLVALITLTGMAFLDQIKQVFAKKLKIFI